MLGFLSDLGPHLLELTSGIVSMVVTGVLSLVFSIYMLSGRDTLISQCRPGAAGPMCPPGLPTPSPMWST